MLSRISELQMFLRLVIPEGSLNVRKIEYK